MKKLFSTLLGFILAGGIALAAITVTVQSGDSLGSIAARNNTTVAELQRLNGLKSINIRVGQVLRIPQPNGITVRSGDSLESIAARYGVSVTALRAANGILGDRIRVGQELKLPSSNTPVSSSRPSNTRASANTVIVQDGDTLGEIAQRNNLSTADLRAANNLSGDSLRIGQILKLPNPKVIAVKPSSPSSTGTVIVENGDTLGEIAQRNNTSIEALQVANNLSGINIRVGQELKLPKTAKPTTSTARVVSGSVIVQAGDSLEKIAKRNNISVEALRAANNLSGDAIRVGDTLRLSSSSPASKPVVASKPKVSSKPSAAKPKPSAVTAKPKPSVVAAKPSNKPAVSSKPVATTKPAVSSKPVVAAKPKAVPTIAAKPLTPKPNTTNTRVIAPPPNLPTATGRTVTIQSPVVQAPKPAPKPQNVATASVKPSSLPPIQTVTAPKPQVTTSAPASTPATVARQPAPKPSPVVAVKPSPVITAKPENMPSTLGFNEPLEITVGEDDPLIDPALESPFFDATAPESKPTAPSDLAPEDIEIIIPDNQSAASVTPTPDSPTFSRAEKLLWPLSGTMTSRFGWRSLRGNRYHTGIDLAAPKGTRVYAALSGRVEFAGWNRQGYGNLIIIRGWDNRRYYYGHNSRLQVKKGQWVRQGQVISRVGSTGFSTGPHLHFEIRVGNRARNPLAYLPRSRLALASSRR
jgi:murein DD-endopeptidase MepM/ murein hydrolase activator NlpD